MHEEFDVEHTLVAEVFEHTPQMPRSGALQRRGGPRRQGKSQDAVAVQVSIERVDRHFAVSAASADDRHLVIEGDEFLVDQRHAPKPAPGRCGLLGTAHHRLAFAVVAEASGLEHAR